MSPYIMPGLIKKQLDLFGIVHAVSDHLEIAPDLITKKSMVADKVYARRLVFYFARKYTILTLEGIGTRMNISVSSIYDGVEIINQEMEAKNYKTVKLVTAIKRTLMKEYKMIN